MPETTPTRCRHDGWTDVRRAAFLVMLRRGGDVAAAAAHVGMSRTSAYRLRDRAAGAAFRAAWDVALDEAIGEVAETAREVALTGRSLPMTYRGRVFGTRIVHNDALLITLLNRHPARG